MEGIPVSNEKPEKIEFPQLSAEILAMADEDQSMRMATNEGGEWDHDVDVRNTERMKGIISEIGWPTKSKVGEWPSYNAWLLVQHAMHDIDFMRHCLELMRAAPSEDIDPANIAMLEDRLNTHDGLPQKYGTQYNPNGERFEVEDMQKLEELRRSVGLPSIAEEEEDRKQ